MVALFNLQGGEIILILALVLILFGAKQLPGSARRLGRDGELGGFKRAVQDLLDLLGSDKRFHQPDYSGEPRMKEPPQKSLALWIAQGFGAGKMPFAPGTFGTFPGLVWFVLLLLTGKLWLFLAGIVAGVALSIWLCGEAERILQQTDPPSVVLDEVIAVPICFVPWVVGEWLRRGEMPPVETFFSAQTWWITAVLFALFRAFDILKPWPIRQSQRLPGGWGVTVDDVLAAGCVALLSLLADERFRAWCLGRFG